MRILDPHVHVYKNDPAYPWAPETRTPPQEDATPEMLLALMEANGVEKTVLVQVIHYRWDNRFVADTLRRYPDKFMGVCRVNPEDPAAPDHLRMWAEEQGLHGVRLSPGEGPEGDWFAGPLMDPLFARAASLKVPVLILTKPGRLPDLARLLERHGGLDVCVDHMADCHPDRPDQVQKLLDLARFPRVFVKISHTWSISREDYPWSDTHGMVKQVIDAFGADRCMWGTDWPVCLSRTPYAQTLRVVRDEMKFLSDADKEWVLGGTVLRLWPFNKA
ncbi:MAG: amidohydrolase [Candidatus Latescibacteria bacterium]|nr:amidohydrolase [Candidatus Latescibacterota bacterium]